MKKLRVLMLVHWSLVPPEDLRERTDERYKKFQTEFDVKTALTALGHEVQVIGIYDDIAPLRKLIEEWKPHIAFNLLEDFAGNSALDYYIVSFLEMLQTPYTGCNPRGLLLARDKALSKKILTYHRLSVPDFAVFAFGKKIGRLSKFPYPAIVKSRMEEGSVGISQASVVHNAQELRERAELIFTKTKGDAIVEQYIDGRELYVSILGNHKLEALPIRELVFKNPEPGAPKLATYKVKWDDDYRKRSGIEYQFLQKLPNGLGDHVENVCKRVYRQLEMTGYGRVDLRLTDKGEVYVLEANPNPGIAQDEDTALSAVKSGMAYEDFIQRLVTLGLSARGADEG
jgi:D-alanine-D-alanine ligase